MGVGTGAVGHSKKPLALCLEAGHAEGYLWRVAGSAPLVHGLHSGGLKQIRGSWLCSGPGL